MVGVRATLGVAWLLVCVAGCKCERTPQPDAHDVADRAACASACAALVTAGCERPGFARADQGSCVASCLADSGESAGSCRQERRAYLGCVARQEPECAELRSSAWLTISEARGISGCDAAHQSWSRCAASCRNSGTTHTGETAHAKYEIALAGCADCPKSLLRGAPSGAPCQSYSVCAQVCCSCAASPRKQLVRACIDGECASAERACGLERRLGLCGP